MKKKTQQTNPHELFWMRMFHENGQCFESKVADPTKEELLKNIQEKAKESYYDIMMYRFKYGMAEKPDGWDDEKTFDYNTINVFYDILRNKNLKYADRLECLTMYIASSEHVAKKWLDVYNAFYEAFEWQKEKYKSFSRYDSVFEKALDKAETIWERNGETGEFKYNIN